MIDFETITTLVAFPQCFVEIEDLGLYRILPIPTYLEMEEQAPQAQQSFISMILRQNVVPKQVQPKLYSIVPVVEEGKIYKQRPEVFFGHKLWTTLLLARDEGGIRTKVIGVQSLDDAGKRAVTYNNAEIQCKVTDRGKAALAMAEELGLLKQMEEIWAGMAQVLT